MQNQFKSTGIILQGECIEIRILQTGEFIIAVRWMFKIEAPGEDMLEGW